MTMNLEPELTGRVDRAHAQEAARALDIAAYGRASQSSFSPWSKSDDPQRAARQQHWTHQTDGITDYAFHTALEEEPWWQLELPAPVRGITAIVIHNRRRQLQERAHPLRVEVWNEPDGGAPIVAYQGDTVFGCAPEGIPLSIPVDPTISIRKIRIILRGRQYLHLFRIQLLADSMAWMKSIPLRIGILGTSNSVMAQGWTKSLAELLAGGNTAIDNISLGSSQAGVVPFQMERHASDQARFDFLILDIAVNEQRLLALNEYDLDVSADIFRWFLTRAEELHARPIVLIMPCLFGYDDFFPGNWPALRAAWVARCNELRIPYFDGYAFTENHARALDIKPRELFKDDSHLRPEPAQALGRELARQLPTLLFADDWHRQRIRSSRYYVYDLASAVADSPHASGRIVERGTRLGTHGFVRLVEGQDHVVTLPTREHEGNHPAIVALAFNMAATNAILEIRSGSMVFHKDLSSAYFDPERQLWLVVWSLFHPVQLQTRTLTLRCLDRAQASALDAEPNDHGDVKPALLTIPSQIELNAIVYADGCADRPAPSYRPACWSRLDLGRG